MLTRIEYHGRISGRGWRSARTALAPADSSGAFRGRGLKNWVPR